MATIAELRAPDESAVASLVRQFGQLLQTASRWSGNPNQPDGMTPLDFFGVGGAGRALEKIATGRRVLPTMTQPADPDVLDLAGWIVAGAKPARAGAKAVAREIAGTDLKVGPAAQRGLIGGEKASTADRAALAKAKEMAAAGADRREIWDATGWYKGPEGKWKFEIDDSNARLISSLRPEQRLGEFLDHPELAAAYADAPETLLHGGNLGNMRGGANSRTGELLLNNRYPPEQQLSTILHESQHGIQKREGFERGGLPKGYGAGQALTAENVADYKRLAGEAEARMVQARRNMSPEERRALPPWESYDTPWEMLLKKGDQGGISADLESVPATRKRAKTADTANPEVIAAETRLNQGYSVSLDGDIPKNGYMVGRFANDDPHTMVVDGAATPQHIEEFIAKNRDVLSEPDTYIGTWVEDGKTYIDVSKRFSPKDKKRAIELAGRNRQLAIWDVGAGKSIETQMPELATRYPQTAIPTSGYDAEKAAKGRFPYFAQKEMSPEAEQLKVLRDAAQRDIDAGNYTPHFDISKRKNVPEGVYPHDQGNTLTDAMPKKQATIDQWMERFDTPEVRQRIDDAITSGSQDPNAKDWYAMKQLYDEFVKLLGKKDGKAAFKARFADAMGATTGGSDPGSNLLTSAYANYVKESGQQFPRNRPHAKNPKGDVASYDLPYPIGGRYVGGNIEMADDVMMGGNPLTAADQPKRYNFAGNFMGRKNNGTIDEQMMTLYDPSGKEQAPPGDSYGILEWILQDVAGKRGLPAMNGQDVGWLGAKKVKKPNAKSKPMIQEVNEMLERTSRITGLPVKKVIEGYIRGNMPMYSLGGVTLGGGLTLGDLAYPEAP